MVNELLGRYFEDSADRANDCSTLNRSGANRSMSVEIRQAGPGPGTAL